MKRETVRWGRNGEVEMVGKEKVKREIVDFATDMNTIFFSIKGVEAKEERKTERN